MSEDIEYLSRHYVKKTIDAFCEEFNRTSYLAHAILHDYNLDDEFLNLAINRCVIGKRPDWFIDYINLHEITEKEIEILVTFLKFLLVLPEFAREFYEEC